MKVRRYNIKTLFSIINDERIYILILIIGGEYYYSQGAYIRTLKKIYVKHTLQDYLTKLTGKITVVTIAVGIKSQKLLFTSEGHCPESDLSIQKKITQIYSDFHCKKKLATLSHLKGFFNRLNILNKIPPLMN